MAQILRLCSCLVIVMASGGAQAEPALSPDVLRVTMLTHNGGRVDWSPQNKIAFDRRSDDGYYQVWIMDADGGNQKCLTCAAPGAPARNKGNPAWYPSGEYIVFQGQKETMPSFLNHLAEPGRGVGNNLWLMTADGKQYWEIVNADRGGAPAGVLHPHFSRDGEKLVWTQLIGADGKLGDWVLHVADFAIRNGTPVLANERTFQPGSTKKFFESHGFYPDGSRILYSAENDTGFDDEFSMNLASSAVRNLTNSPSYWSEHAQISPDGRHTREYRARDRALALWINHDPTKKR